MAVRSARTGFGLWRAKPPKPSFRGTKAAFEAGEKVFKKTKGATPDLRRVVKMHFANTVSET